MKQEFITSDFQYLEQFFRQHFICDDELNIEFIINNFEVIVFSDKKSHTVMSYRKLISWVLELEDDNLRIVNILKDVKLKFPLGGSNE